jgi:hypothetical protein
MSFTGDPVVEKVAEDLFRITGVRLDPNQTGTIGLVDKTVPSEITLNSKEWGRYRNGEVDLIGLTSSVEVRILPTTDVGVAVPLVVTKVGNSPKNFEISIENPSGDGNCDTVRFRLTLQFAEGIDPAVINVSEETQGPDCTLTCIIQWDAGANVTPVLLADIEAAFQALGYTIALQGVLGSGDRLAPIDFGELTGDINSYIIDEPCDFPLTWDMQDLELVLGTGPALPLVDPQPPESPPNSLAGTIDAPEDRFVCNDGTASAELEIYVRFH